MTRAEIPNSVTRIGLFAFTGASKLTIFCESENRPSGGNEMRSESNNTIVWGYTE